jgi:hypothetical protein
MAVSKYQMGCRLFLMGIDMSELETLAYILLKSLYVFGIVCGLTPPLLLIAVLLVEWRRAKNVRAVNVPSSAPAFYSTVTDPQHS